MQLEGDLVPSCENERCGLKTEDLHLNFGHCITIWFCLTSVSLDL